MANNIIEVSMSNHHTRGRSVFVVKYEELISKCQMRISDDLL